MSNSSKKYHIKISRVNNVLGITKEYNKENREELWDDDTAKKNFKDKSFKDKKVLYDPISGEYFHSSQKAAQNKYHMKNSSGENISKEWGKYSAETDHINAIQDVHRIAKYNPFLSDADFKEIINNDNNYRLLSKSMNASKGSDSDYKLVKQGVKKKNNKIIKGEAYYDNNELSKEAKKTILKQKTKADLTLHREFTKATLKNMGNEFVSGAAYTVYDSIVPLTAEGMKKAVDIAQGKENITDAAKDMTKTTLTLAAEGGAKRIATDAIMNLVDQNTRSIINEIANNRTISQIMAAAIMTREVTTKYINGEIDEKEFANEVGQRGALMIAAMAGDEIGKKIGTYVGAIIGTTLLPGAGTVPGAVVGAIVGKLLGSIITTVSCALIVTTIESNKELNLYILKEKEIRKIKSQALAEINNQRNNFKNIIKQEVEIFDETIESGIDQILYYACAETYSFEGMSDGIDKILSVFGKSVYVKNLDEYKKQLSKPIII